MTSTIIGKLLKAASKSLKCLVLRVPTHGGEPVKMEQMVDFFCIDDYDGGVCEWLDPMIELNSDTIQGYRLLINGSFSFKGTIQPKILLNLS